MSKSYEFKNINQDRAENLKSIIIEMKENNSDKNEICSHLIRENIEFSEVQKFLDFSEISFKREKSKWDQFSESFKSDYKISKSELSDYLQKEHDWSEKDSKKYSSSYFNVFSDLRDFYQDKIEELENQLKEKIEDSQ